MSTTSTSTNTRAQLLYNVLRAEILAGTLAPSTRLRLVDLGERFSVSQTVVREALTRLAEQKIVDSLPMQGFRVASLTLKDLTALTEARLHIESLVLRLAIERGDINWETSVVAANHRLSRTPNRLDTGEINEQWLIAHDAFHSALLEGCNNHRLLHAAASLRDAAALYRIWSVPLGRDYHRDLNGEHTDLRDAALARDADTAVARLEAHIERTSSALIPVAER